MATVTQSDRSERTARLKGPVLTIAALGAATLALRLRDPHHSGSWGYCPLQAVTGIYCPGCGGLRAVNDLTQGEVGAALSSNLLVTLGIPIAILVLGLGLWSAWYDRPRPRLPARVATLAWSALAVVAFGFTVLRNTPAGSWLAP